MTSDSGTKLYRFSDFSEMTLRVGCRGNQPKVTDGQIWVKADMWGYEALAEIIAYRAAVSLGLPAVEYKPCFAYTGNETVSACVSDNFIPQCYDEVTLYELLMKITGYSDVDELYGKLFKKASTAEQIQRVIETVDGYVDVDSFAESFATLLWFDSIIFNTDRHLNNIIMLYDEDRNFYPAPIFDCGAALLSDTDSFSMDLPVFKALKRAKSKPFSTDFKKQAAAVADYLKRPPVDTVQIDVSDLYEYYSMLHINRALNALQIGLDSNNIGLEVTGKKKPQ